jgi:hypothetical protein
VRVNIGISGGPPLLTWFKMVTLLGAGFGVSGVAVSAWIEKSKLSTGTLCIGIPAALGYSSPKGPLASTTRKLANHLLWMTVKEFTPVFYINYNN